MDHEVKLKTVEYCVSVFEGKNPKNLTRLSYKLASNETIVFKDWQKHKTIYEILKIAGGYPIGTGQEPLKLNINEDMSGGMMNNDEFDREISSMKMLAEKSKQKNENISIQKLTKQLQVF